MGGGGLIVPVVQPTGFGFVEWKTAVAADMEGSMRAILVLLALVVIGAIVLVAMGIIDVNQTRQAQAPGVSGGQTPAYNVEVNPIEVGTKTTNVQVPVVEMKTRQVKVPAIGVADSDPPPPPPANSQ